MRTIFLILFSLYCSLCNGQDNDILLTINNESITVGEFVNVYKKNRGIIADEQSQSPAEYLSLFIDYKLKVQEAITLGYAENFTHKNELEKYRNQLAKNFIKDTQVTDALVREAYGRTLNEVNARHILIKLSPDADTIQAYQKITDARNRIIAGENFTAVAKEVSEDPSARSNGGELGWFKAFKMVYTFEDAAYTTKLNEVSAPFRSQFGYHIVQPSARRVSEGSIQVAHIMIAHRQRDTSIVASQKIQEMYALLNQGSTFETLARTYSDDRNSSNKGGILAPIEKGKLSSKEFEKIAFNLKKAGDVSVPFKTDFGWHIVRLIEKNPVGSFESMKEELAQKVTRDARSQVIDKTLRKKLRQRYGVEENNDLISYFISVFKNDKTGIKSENKPVLSNIAFSVNEVSYAYEDVYSYLLSKAKSKSKQYRSSDAFVKEEIDKYIDTTLKKYHLEHLENEDPAFNAVLREYREGLLLFDLLEANVWKIATSDSIGLKSYYENNQESYKSNKSVKADRFIIEDKKIAKKVKSLLMDEVPIPAIVSRFNDQITVQENIIIPSDGLQSSIEIKEGISNVVNYDSDFLIYNIKKIIPAQLQSLDKIKGRVMSDFQKELEVVLVNELKSKATIIINEEVLTKISERYENK